MSNLRLGHRSPLDYYYELQDLVDHLALYDFYFEVSYLFIRGLPSEYRSIMQGYTYDCVLDVVDHATDIYERM